MQINNFSSTPKNSIVSSLLWFEEHHDFYVKIIRNPSGIDFPNDDYPETKTMCIQQNVRIGDLKKIINDYPQDNIWRSWRLFLDESCENDGGCSPFLLDIDNEDQNLQNAYILTQKCLGTRVIQENFPNSNHLRVVFSGKKGFHIEGKPIRPIDSRSLRTSILCELESEGLEQLGVNNCFRDGVIDVVHNCVRVTESFNSWKEHDVIKKRKVIQLSLEDFQKMSIQEIIFIAENS